MKWLKKNWVTVLLGAIFLIGVGLLVYPSFSDYWNSFHQTRAIMHYAEAVANMDTEEYDRLLESAGAYNERVAKRGNKWVLTDAETEAYNNELDFTDDGNMGYITIPKISVMLPIYHGTSDRVLQSSIGHLEGTSLPVGGVSSHSVLSGHRGLPSAKLFTDLDKLSEGDTFTLNILNETLTYEVDRIRIVEPTDLSDLQIVEGMDYCTLVTCTPYGINTHRLLVRGHRVANAHGEAKITADSLVIDPIYVAPFVGAPILVLLLTLVLVLTSSGYRKKKVDRKVKYMDEKGLDEVTVDVPTASIFRITRKNVLSSRAKEVLQRLLKERESRRNKDKQ
jgi:sortase A